MTREVLCEQECAALNIFAAKACPCHEEAYARLNENEGGGMDTTEQRRSTGNATAGENPSTVSQYRVTNPGPSEKRSVPAFGCQTCGKRWGGQKTSHCIVCHETFSSPATFDMHWAGRSDRDCAPYLSKVGLFVSKRSGYEVWALPAPDEPVEWWKRDKSVMGR